MCGAEIKLSATNAFLAEELSAINEINVSRFILWVLRNLRAFKPKIGAV